MPRPDIERRVDVKSLRRGMNESDAIKCSLSRNQDEFTKLPVWIALATSKEDIGAGRRLEG